MLKAGTVHIQEKTIINFKLLLKILLNVLVSFALASSTIGGLPSPLITAYIGIVHVTSGIFGFIGAMAAYFFSGKMMLAIPQIISILIIIIFKIVYTEIFSKELKAVGCSLLTGITYCISGAAYVFFTASSGSAAFLIACEGIFCGCAAYFLKLALSSYKSERKLVLTGLYGAATSAVFVLIVTSLSSISFSIFNIGRIIAIFTVLICAKKFKHIGGAISGALATCGMTLYSAGFGKTSMLISISAIVAGCFAEFGTIMICVFFIGSTAIGLIITGITPDTAKVLVDTVVACVLFIAIPDKVYSAAIGSTTATKTDSKIADIAASRLNFAATTIADVKKSIEQVSKALEKTAESNDICTMVCDEVCYNCKNNLYCWEKDFDKTFDQFHLLSNAIEIKKTITLEDIPQNMCSCYRKPAIIDSFNSCYAQKNHENFAVSKIKDMRGILFEQFGAMEDMLNEISAEISSGKQLDQYLSKEVTSFLYDFGAKSPEACVFYDNFNRIYIEVFYHGDLKLTKEEISLELSDITDRTLDIPEISTIDGINKLTVMEKTYYDVEIKSAQKPCVDGEPSGDTSDYFFDGRGNAYFIISDGMGTGKYAAVDSRLTVNLLIRLLKAGIGYNAAVKLINSSVIAKSHDESFATMDICCVNLYTGRLDILKLGSSVTFVKSENKITHYNTISMPLGILHDPIIDKMGTVLKENDAVVMISDGISEHIYPFIKDNLQSSVFNPSNLAESVVKKIEEVDSKSRRDDVSIIAFKLIKKI